MFKTYEGADVAVSVRAYQHHAGVARKCLLKAETALASVQGEGERARLLATVGGPQTGALAKPMLARWQAKASRLAARVRECENEVEHWEGAARRIVTMHAETHARRYGWKAPRVRSLLELIEASDA